jgi:hypothetical protein
MPSSPENLLEAIATSLRETVAPRIDDAFARAQVAAAAEVLDNLAVRVQWRDDQLRARCAQLRTLLMAACERAPENRLPRTQATLAAAQDQPVPAVWEQSLDALAEVQGWLAAPTTDEPALAAELARFLRADYEHEQSLLRRVMFSDPRRSR